MQAGKATLSGMQVVITGANRGIGLGLAAACWARGDIVHACARQPERADELQALGRREGNAARLFIHRLDVTRDDDCARLGRELQGASAPIDLLINNAGVGSGYGGLDDVNIAEALRAYDVNALGPVRVTRALRTALRAGRGKVMNVTSTMGSIADNSSGRAYGYRMSKAALNMATRNLAHDLAPQGITVFCVNPGWVQTDMGGSGAPTTVDESVAHLLKLADSVGAGDGGKFFHAKGHSLPW